LIVHGRSLARGDYLAKYNNVFEKAASFWNKYYTKLKATGGSQEFWDEIYSLGGWFKGDTEQKIFVLLIEELERRSKEG